MVARLEEKNTIHKHFIGKSNFEKMTIPAQIGLDNSSEMFSCDEE